MIRPSHFDAKEIRTELGLSQSALAALVGVSNRAIQSYEQGWRRPSEMVQRMLFLLVIAYRNGNQLARARCWEAMECLPEIRNHCIAYLTRQGHLCWFLTGTMCQGQNKRCWDEKLRECLKCSFLQSLLTPPTDVTALQKPCCSGLR